MGGFGSGGLRWGRRRTAIDQSFVLDANLLARAGLFSSQGALALDWQAFSGVAVFNARVQAILIALSGVGNPIEQFIEVSPTRCHLGGERYYFACPECGTRAVKLYWPRKDMTRRLDHGPFACRRCWDLVYASRNIKNEFRVAIRRVGRIQRKLGVTPCTFGELPPRPPRMRSRTYDELAKEFATERGRAGRLLILECVRHLPNKLQVLTRAAGEPNEYGAIR